MQNSKVKSQKLLIIIFLVGLFLFFAPGITQAGIVPCGLSEDDPDQPGDQTVPCTLCHFFVMFENIIDFIFIKLVPPIAILMLVIGGVMFFFAGGSPGALARAKSIITTTVIGLIIIYVAFILIGMFLLSIGLADWTTDIYKTWWEEGFFTIECPT